jgi:conjugative transfer pilus assembly protein TraH
MQKLVKLTFMLFCLSFTAHADINGELAKVWTSLGAESVTNRSKYYKGQQRGHYTMGSMYFARAKKNRPLVSVNFPEIDLDTSCYNQGVLNFGGLSFIKGDALKNKMQDIMQQAGMMFVYLGISSISPVIGETLQEVYSKLQELGGFLSDECQASKQIVSFLGDKLSQHSETAKSIFSKFKPSKGDTTDLSYAYQKYPEGKAEILQKAIEKDERYALENINLAWKALSKLKLDNDKDKELKEMMMTISGTIIIKANKDGPPQFQYVSSMVTAPSILEALLKGDKSMKILSCGKDTDCLNVSETYKLIKAEDSFEQKVADYFEKFKEALEQDMELEDKAQTFLAKSGTAAFKIYDTLYQYTKSNPEYEQGIVVEIVAWNILYNYLSDILKEVKEATNNLQIAASNELKEFKESIETAQKVLAGHEMKDLSRYKLQLSLIKRAENMEEVMSNETAQIFNMARQ